MDITMVGAWMLWSSDAVKHERYYDLGMDALVIGCSQTCTPSQFGHGCSGRSSDAVEHDHYYGLAMDALVVGCSRT